MPTTWQFVAIGGPNEVDKPHLLRFSPDDSTASFVENLYRYDWLSAWLRVRPDHVLAFFTQKTALTRHDLEVILNDGDAKQIPAIDFLYFTGHSSNGEFEFYESRRDGDHVGLTKLPARDLVRRLREVPGLKNIMIASCGWLPDSQGKRQRFLSEHLDGWTGDLFVALSPAGEDTLLGNRDCWLLLSRIMCCVFDRHVYQEKRAQEMTIAEAIRAEVSRTFDKGYLSKNGFCLVGRVSGRHGLLYFEGGDSWVRLEP